MAGVPAANHRPGASSAEPCETSQASHSARRRQTGKTEAVRHLGSHFDLLVELNLERFDDLSLVRAANSADEMLLALRARLNISSFPARTLLFIDEIQESSEAVQWQRFLFEDHPQMAFVGAGSLMEVRLRDKGFSFPVGRGTFKTLRPFSFFEMLRAADREVLAQTLEQAVGEAKSIPTTLLDQARHQLRTYLQVGGMPEDLFFWISESSRSNAEVDFLISSGNELLPIEVKASAAGSLKSLHQFLWLSGRHEGIRLYEGKPGTESLTVQMQDCEFEYRLRSRPLWAASLLT